MKTGVPCPGKPKEYVSCHVVVCPVCLPPAPAPVGMLVGKELEDAFVDVLLVVAAHLVSHLPCDGVVLVEENVWQKGAHDLLGTAIGIAEKHTGAFF